MYVFAESSNFYSVSKYSLTSRGNLWSYLNFAIFMLELEKPYPGVFSRVSISLVPLALRNMFAEKP